MRRQAAAEARQGAIVETAIVQRQPERQFPAQVEADPLSGLAVGDIVKVLQDQHATEDGRRYAGLARLRSIHARQVLVLADMRPKLPHAGIE